MTENEFSDMLVERLSFESARYSIATRKNVAYNLTIDTKGDLDLNFDAVTGEATRKGQGFQQDILVYEEMRQGRTSIVPRVIIEVKLDKVNSHSAIVYSEKARKIKSVYPYVRYGFLLGGFEKIPRRVLRLEENFDFIHTISGEPTHEELDSFREIIDDELRASDHLSSIYYQKSSIRSLRHVLTVKT